MSRAVFKPAKRKQKSYGSGGSPSGTGKPCPTCYAPMELRQGNDRSHWACPSHGKPAKP